MGYGGVVALEWTGTAEQVVLASVTVVAVGVLWRYLVRPIWRFYRWARLEVRDEIERRKKVDELIHRELTPNSGSSMKDQTTAAAQRLGQLEDVVDELRSAQHTTTVVLDRIIEHKALDHDEIWKALALHGIDRRDPRRPSRRSTDSHEGETPDG
jgi:hypothetical protein